VLIVLVVPVVFYMIRETLFIFVLAVLLAHHLSPLVDLIDRLLPASRTRTRTPALAMAYVIFVGVVVLVSIQFGSVAATQATALATKFPAILRDALNNFQSVNTGISSLDDMKAQAMEGLQTKLGEVAAQLPATSMKVVAVLSNLIYVVIIPILSFFFLKDARVIRQHIIDLVDETAHRSVLEDILEAIHLVLSRYMRALVLLSASTFTSYGIFFLILGVPFGVLLAALAGILEFIPMIGPFVAGVTVVLVAGLTTGHVVPVLIFLVAYRLFQDYILAPHLMEQGVEIHPLLVLFGVFAGAEIAGIPGTFLSVPVLAMVRIVYLRLYKARIAARLAPDGV
jgi:predicted PurR-regulated permease PerM